MARQSDALTSVEYTAVAITGIGWALLLLAYTPAGEGPYGGTALLAIFLSPLVAGWNLTVLIMRALGRRSRRSGWALAAVWVVASGLFGLALLLT